MEEREGVWRKRGREEEGGREEEVVRNKLTHSDGGGCEAVLRGGVGCGALT